MPTAKAPPLCSQSFPINRSEPVTKCHKKSVAITVVALLALGAIVMGILGIIASLPGGASGLSAMSPIGWQGGAGLAAAGTFAFVGLIIVSMIQFRKRGNEVRAEDRGESSEPLMIRHVPPPLTAIRGMINGFTDEQILALDLRVIDGYSNEERSLIYERLLVIDRKEDTSSPHQAINAEPLTLGALRSLMDTGLLEKMNADAIPQQCLGMLNAMQLGVILRSKDTLSTDVLKQLMPTEKAYTYEKIKKIQPAIFEKHFQSMTGSHFRLLPLDCFKSVRFPWDIVISSPKNLKKVLGTELVKTSFLDTTDQEFTQQVLRIIPIETIQKLACAFSCKHLPLISQDHLKHLNFPWRAFLEKEGIGSALHQLDSTFLATTHFPWKEFVEMKKEKELADLLSMKRSKSGSENEWRDEFTKNIFKHLEITIISQLAPGLSSGHLSFMPEEHLKHLNFPWRAFLEKKGIGSALHSFHTDLLLKTAIPWEQFANKKDEIEVLLSTREARSGDHPQWDHTFTKSILNGIAIDSLKALKNHLTDKHSNMLTQDRWRALGRQPL